jgi:hypothetical protein
MKKIDVIINRKVNDEVNRKMGKKIKDECITNRMYIYSRLRLPILNNLNQIVDFNGILKI